MSLDAKLRGLRKLLWRKLQFAASPIMATSQLFFFSILQDSGNRPQPRRRVRFPFLEYSPDGFHDDCAAYQCSRNWAQSLGGPKNQGA